MFYSRKRKAIRRLPWPKGKRRGKRLAPLAIRRIIMPKYYTWWLVGSDKVVLLHIVPSEMSMGPNTHLWCHQPSKLLAFSPRFNSYTQNIDGIVMQVMHDMQQLLESLINQYNFKMKHFMTVIVLYNENENYLVNFSRLCSLLCWMIYERYAIR